VQAILKAFNTYLPEMTEVFEEAAPSFGTSGEKDAIQLAYSQCKNISIDYGIMEKADNVYVALSKFPWSDLGSWASLHEISARDGSNNDVKADALIYDTRNSIIRGPEGKLIVVQGLNGYLVGVFDNVVIVCEKDKEDMFRKFVADVKAKGNDKYI
jgi:mannose-1-phosphate guanylyltransferase